MNSKAITQQQIKKVLVSGHDLKFWRPLQAHLEATGQFEFREDEWRGHNEHDPKQTLDGIEWADIIVAEWMLGNAVFCARHKKPNQRLVTRLHLQERGTDFPAQIDYNNVDLVIFVGAHIQEECIRKFNMPRHKTSVIGNFIDQKRFDLPKFGGSEFNLGIIGTAPARKRLDLALDALEVLLQKDERYTLHVKGASPDSYSWLWARTNEREYYEQVYERINSSDLLRYKVIFDPPGNDVHRWLQKIGYILSPSDFESFHVAVAEGMSSGAVPVVWAWEGANTIYPFLEFYNDPQQAANYIDKLQLSDSRPRLAVQCVEFIKKHYDAAVIRDKWLEALKSSQLSVDLRCRDNKTRKGVLLVYSIDKWETFHRREMLEALSKRISTDYDILIIEPGTHYATLLEKGVCCESELNKYAQLKPVQVAENIYKIRILLGPIPPKAEPHKKLLSADNYQNAIQIAAREIFGYGRKLVHWIYKPNHHFFVPDRQSFIYEVYDEYTMDFSTGQPIKEMVEMEPPVLAGANHVFFTSEPLAERKKCHCRSWSVVGNGVAFEVFDAYRIETPDDASLRRSVGYLGNLSDFFDWQLMTDVAIAMPEVDFFFHGQIEHHRLAKVKDQVDRLMGMPNTYFSGRVTRPVGAAAINRYDALIIPFVVNEAMHAVNPLKLWEYLSAGKPVVMTPMDAVESIKDVVFFAKTPKEWVDVLESLLSQDGDHISTKCVLYSKPKAWDTLTREHARYLISVLC
jgi:glycosyltransferase involved in cell wall biosynthesis